MRGGADVGCAWLPRALLCLISTLVFPAGELFLTLPAQPFLRSLNGSQYLDVLSRPSEYKRPS